MKKIKIITLLLLGFCISASVYSQNKMVGGAMMYPEKNIVENAVNSKDHTILVSAVKEAGLVSTLEGKGPFTVFAPTNAAFKMLPEGTLKSLMMPENKAKLSSILTYHVVAGKYSANDIMKMIKKNKGTATLKTVQGEDLQFMMKGKNLFISDANGNMAMVEIPDVNQSNGVIHVINKVLLPK